MLKRISNGRVLVVLLLVVLWCPMVGHAGIAHFKKDNFSNIGTLASGSVWKTANTYIEYSFLKNINNDMRELYELRIGTIYWSITAPNKNALHKYFTEITLQFDGKASYTLPEPSLTFGKHEFTTKAEKYWGECRIDINSSGNALRTVIPLLINATNVKAQIVFNTGESVIVDIPAEILNEWKKEIIPYKGALSYKAQ